MEKSALFDGVWVFFCNGFSDADKELFLSCGNTYVYGFTSSGEVFADVSPTWEWAGGVTKTNLLQHRVMWQHLGQNFDIVFLKYEKSEKSRLAVAIRKKPVLLQRNAKVSATEMSFFSCVNVPHEALCFLIS